MFSFIFVTLFCFIFSRAKAGLAGINDIPNDSNSDEGEVRVEIVPDDNWIPSNIFEVGWEHPEIHPKIENVTESPWPADANPLFRALRDFIFQAGDEAAETEDTFGDPTEEVVKALEKGLIEATTMFFSPLEDISTSTEESNVDDPFKVLEIKNDSPDVIQKRMGVLDQSNGRQEFVNSITNTTAACSTCYESLATCVQQCFERNNCNDVKRQAQVCPPPPSRLCTFFTQWSPVEECRSHEDCKSPLLCCNDGCINKCSPGVYS